MPRHDMAIIGAGRMGSALARALHARGAQVTAVASRNHESAEALASDLASDATACSPERACERAQWIFLTVPDDALPSLAAALPFTTGQRVVHCSGALDLSVLAGAQAGGARAGCLHPLQSFPERTDGAERFSGITCGIEGQDALHDELEALCEALGASSLDLRGVDRARYHAAAVLASNYVVALSAAAARAFSLAGLPAERARVALAPLTRGAIDNIERLPLAQALTGPLSRADLETLQRHVAALSDAPELLGLYRALGNELLRLPLALGREQRSAIEALLGAKPGP